MGTPPLTEWLNYFWDPRSSPNKRPDFTEDAESRKDFL